MILRAKVIVKGHHDLKYYKAYNSAVLEARTLELRWDVGLDQQMTLMAKVKVTVTSSTKQA